MKNLILILAVTSTALAPKINDQDDKLEERVQKLEAWKSTAESRIDALEKSAKPRGSVATDSPLEKAERVILVEVKNKRWDPSNISGRNSKFEDNIWWDATYTGRGLAKDARSIKGVLKFCDLFGDPQFQIRVTIDEPIKAGGVITTESVGMEYNQFLADHQWLRATKLKDMTFKFQVTNILYKDKTVERFGG